MPTYFPFYFLLLTFSHLHTLSALLDPNEKKIQPILPSTIHTTCCQNLPSITHTSPSMQPGNTIKEITTDILKGTLFMENTRHFGEPFRKHHWNRKINITDIYIDMNKTSCYMNNKATKLLSFQRKS